MPPITRSSGMRCAMVSQAGVKQQVGPRLPEKQVPVLPLPRARGFKRISQQVHAEEMPQIYEEAVHRPANRSRSSRAPPPPPPPPMNHRQRQEHQAGLSIPKQYYQSLWCIFWAFICWKLACASCDRSCCDVRFSVVNYTNNSTTNSTSTSHCEIIILPGRCSSPDQEIKFTPGTSTSPEPEHEQFNPSLHASSHLLSLSLAIHEITRSILPNLSSFSTSEYAAHTHKIYEHMPFLPGGLVFLPSNEDDGRGQLDPTHPFMRKLYTLNQLAAQTTDEEFLEGLWLQGKIYHDALSHLATADTQITTITPPHLLPLLQRIHVSTRYLLRFLLPSFEAASVFHLSAIEDLISSSLLGDSNQNPNSNTNNRNPNAENYNEMGIGQDVEIGKDKNFDFPYERIFAQYDALAAEMKWHITTFHQTIQSLQADKAEAEEILLSIRNGFANNEGLTWRGDMDAAEVFMSDWLKSQISLARTRLGTQQAAEAGEGDGFRDREYRGEDRDGGDEEGFWQPQTASLLTLLAPSGDVDTLVSRIKSGWQGVEALRQVYNHEVEAAAELAMKEREGKTWGRWGRAWEREQRWTYGRALGVTVMVVVCGVWVSR